MEIVLRYLEAFYEIPVAVVAVIAAIILFTMKKVKHIAICLLILAIILFIFSR